MCYAQAERCFAYSRSSCQDNKVRTLQSTCQMVKVFEAGWDTYDSPATLMKEIKLFHIARKEIFHRRKARPCMALCNPKNQLFRLVHRHVSIRLLISQCGNLTRCMDQAA